MYNEYIFKTFVFRLGTQGKSINNNLSNENIIIVSCSRIVPIKRLDLIARSLCQIKNFKVKWIHYGDGDEMCIRDRHYSDDYQSSGHLYITRVPGIDAEQRQEIIVKMAEAGVAVNVHYKPCLLYTSRCV